MFDFFFPTEGMGSQTLRSLQKQAKVEEILSNRSCLQGNRTWQSSKLGKPMGQEGRGYRDRAEQCFLNGQKRSAMQYFFAANQYWRMADVFLRIDRNDDKAAYFKNHKKNFRSAAALHDPRIEVIEVRGDETYDGYFCHPRNPKPGKWPAIFFIGGADAFAEEIYFSGREMTERGYAMLLVDTPGRGSSMYEREFPHVLIMKYPEKRVSIICSPVPRSTVSGWVSWVYPWLASPLLRTVSSALYLGLAAIQSRRRFCSAFLGA